MACKAKKCQEVVVETCEDDLCEFLLSSECVTIDSTDFEFFNESDGEVTLQTILDELDGLLAQGVTGTFSNPTSVTILNGIIVDIS